MKESSYSDKRVFKAIKKHSACLALNIQGMNPGLRSKSSSKLCMLKEEVNNLAKNNVYVPFIAVVESWLKPFITDAQLNIENYNVYRSDRKLSKNGGALLYTHKDIIIDSSYSFDDNTCNGVVCFSKKSNCFIISVYRPPGSSEQSFSDLLNFLDNCITQHNAFEKLNIYIFGDFNFPKVCWNNLNDVSHKSKDLVNLFNFLDTHLLTQYITESTRNSNLLDLFFSNCPSFVNFSDIVDVSYSDHRLIKIFNTHFSPLSKVVTSKSQIEFSGPDFSVLNLTKTNFELVNKELSDVNWDEVVSVPIDDFPGVLRNVVFQILSKHSTFNITNKRKSRCKFSKNLDAITKKMQKMRKKLKFSLCSSKNRVAFSDKIKKLHDLKKQIIFDKKLFHENKAINKIKHNSKFFFKYVNRFRKSSSSPNIFMDKNNNAVTDPKLMADMLQDQFRGVFSSPLADSKLDANLKFNVPSFNPIPPFEINNSDVCAAIDEMKFDASCTHQDIPAVVFKRCKSSLCKPLKLFFNKSFNEGQIPLIYKKQTVIPLHKKGPKTVPENFRPISLTSHVIKIMERILRKKFMLHLEDNNLINFSQHGFRENRNCCTQLISHINQILSNSIQTNETDCLYLDYSKAFDKVDHGLLIKKLERYGITDKYLKWVSNFLKDRVQVVYLNNTYSYPAVVKSGVPQGSVLGPLLFLIFVNDLPQTISNSNTHILSFADDTKIASKVSNVNDKINLQRDLDNIIKWSISNNMELNNKKFELVSHKLYPDSSNQKLIKQLPFFNCSISYNISKNEVILPSEYVRDLGVYIDSKLNWTFHYSLVTKKAKQLCAWVLNTFYSRDRNTMLILFKSLIRSRLEYSCEVWSPHLIKDINYLEQVQRTFTSKIIGFKDLNYWDRLKKLELYSLQRRRELIIIIHVFKIKNGIYPNTFDLNFKVHKRTNSIKAILKPLPRVRGKLLTTYEESFIIKSCKLWNILPSHLTQLSSLSSFKTQLHKFVSTVPDEPPVVGYPHKNNNSLTEQCLCPT